MPYLTTNGLHGSIISSHTTPLLKHRYMSFSSKPLPMHQLPSAMRFSCSRATPSKVFKRSAKTQQHLLTGKTTSSSPLFSHTSPTAQRSTRSPPTSAIESAKFFTKPVERPAYTPMSTMPTVMRLRVRGMVATHGAIRAYSL